LLPVLFVASDDDYPLVVGRRLQVKYSETQIQHRQERWHYFLVR